MTEERKTVTVEQAITIVSNKIRELEGILRKHPKEIRKVLPILSIARRRRIELVEVQKSMKLWQKNNGVQDLPPVACNSPDYQYP